MFGPPLLTTICPRTYSLLLDFFYSFLIPQQQPFQNMNSYRESCIENSCFSLFFYFLPSKFLDHNCLMQQGAGEALNTHKCRPQKLLKILMLLLTFS